MTLAKMSLHYILKEIIENISLKNNLCDLSNFQRPTVTWKLFTGRFINAVVTAHTSSLAEYGCVAISNNFTLGSGMTQYASTN